MEEQGVRQRKELHRDPERGRIAGVCAGIAEYFGLEVWLVRILTVTGFFLLAGPFMLVAYVAAWFILEKKPTGRAAQAHASRGFKSKGYKGFVSEATGSQYRGKGWCNEDELDEKKVEVKAHVWQAGEPPRQAFFDIKQKFSRIEKRLRNVETYVTSSEFQLNREINKL